MSWIERNGKYLALSFLFLVWPAVDTYQQGGLAGTRLVLAGGGVVAYSLIFGWYCLYGYRIRDARVPMADAALLTLLALALDHLTGQAANNYFLIPLLVVGFGLRPRPALVALAVIAAITLLDQIVLLKAPMGEVVLQSVLVIPGVVIFGGAAMGLRYLLRTLAELRTARAEIAQHAADQERTRIGRDLHDLLGHGLSVITLKGELATRLLPEGAPGADQVRDMLGLSREALQQVRQVVSGYRQPTLANELTAARVALQAASIDLDVTQNVGALDRESEAILGWVIREATTNVIRHSGAKHCSISLGRDDGLLHIEVVNDGWRVPQAPAGNGLRGLEERLATVGGNLEATALPAAGFRVRATLPARARSHPALDVEVSP
jgi:two-component system, NarL family, sensor histidine kinase DesK